MRIKFNAVSSVPVSELLRRKPLLEKYPSPPRARCEHLAVVGGGPSAAHLAKEISDFEEVWALNGAWRWCHDHNIKAKLFTIDPVYDDPAPISIFGDSCKPDVVAKCKRPYVVNLEGISRGTTSATTVPHVAINLGYKSVSFFGCEGSFGEKTHTFKNIGGNRLWVKCDGTEWVTNPQMFMQCEVLAEIIRMAPNVFIGPFRRIVAGND